MGRSRTIDPAEFDSHAARGFVFLGGGATGDGRWSVFTNPGHSRLVEEEMMLGHEGIGQRELLALQDEGKDFVIVQRWASGAAPYWCKIERRSAAPSDGAP